ncbi:MAG: hypothetical protein PSV22_04800 [Pseudolabrys sp.]|nr:hypothetical protein [Pseudolabrys sp.]
MQAGEHDPLGFGGQSEVASIRVERPTIIKVRSDPVLVRSIQDYLAKGAAVLAICDLDGIGSVHLRSNHRNCTPSNQSGHAGGASDFFKEHLRHLSCIQTSVPTRADGVSCGPGYSGLWDYPDMV